MQYNKNKNNYSTKLNDDKIAKNLYMKMSNIR